MIYITQLIFLKEGQEKAFHQFEDIAIPLMAKYTGKVIYRLRPTAQAFVSAEEELPYEVHFLSFESEEDLSRFLNDKSRLTFMHLKEDSIRSSLLIKGRKM